MKRIKVVGLCLFAVSVSSAVAAPSASASAFEWHVNGKLLSEKPEETIKGVTYKAGEEGIAANKLAVTNGLLKSDGIEIACPKLTLEGGVIKADGEINVSDLKFTSCEVTNTEHCVFTPKSGTITTEGGGMLAEFISETKIKFTPATKGDRFATINLENETGFTCLVEGSYEMIGFAEIEIPTLGEEAKEHAGELSGSETDSLTIKGELITPGKELRIVSGLDWGARF